jgi:hypothetical protein
MPIFFAINPTRNGLESYLDIRGERLAPNLLSKGRQIFVSNFINTWIFSGKMCNMQVDISLTLCLVSTKRSGFIPGLFNDTISTRYVIAWNDGIKTG